MVHKAKVTSQFLGDRTKDQSFLCALRFHKFMRCNERSPVKINEATVFNGSFQDYKCFEELEELFEVCIIYHFKVLFEMYYYRVYNNYFKPMSHQRQARVKDITYAPESGQKLYY
jgi:hypothetical protein